MAEALLSKHAPDHRIWLFACIERVVSCMHCLECSWSQPSGLPSTIVTASSRGPSTACVPMRRSYTEAAPRLRLLYMMPMNPPSIQFSIKGNINMTSKPAHLATLGASSSQSTALIWNTISAIQHACSMNDDLPTTISDMGYIDNHVSVRYPHGMELDGNAVSDDCGAYDYSSDDLWDTSSEDSAGQLDGDDSCRIQAADNGDSYHCLSEKDDPPRATQITELDTRAS